MNTRYLNRIGTLQLKSKPLFKYKSKSSLDFNPKSKPTTTSKHKTKKTVTFKDELDNVRIQIPRSPSSKDPEPSSCVNEILASDSVKYRIIGYAIDSGDNIKSTIVRFYKREDKDGNLEKRSLPITFDFGPIRIRRSSDIIRQAASTLARLLERWPHTLDFSTRRKRVLVDVALERTASKVSKIYPTIDFDSPKSIYWSTVDGIDPDNGKPYSVFVGVRPKNITNFEVPETPETERFRLL